MFHSPLALVLMCCVLMPSGCQQDVLTGYRCRASGCGEQEDTSAPEAEADAAAVGAPGDGLCMPNPSFEGSFFPFPVPDWTTCIGSPDTSPGLAILAASDGDSYLGLLVSSQESLLEATGTALCQPMTPGQAVPFSIDMTLSSTFGPVLAAPSRLQVWGGTAACRQDELLWTSPLLEAVDSWQPHCATLMPSAAYDHLVLAPVMDGASLVSHYLLLDHIGSSACQ